MVPLVSPGRVARLVEGFDTSPAYGGLAEALRLAIGDARIPVGTRLPSERDLADTLALSRATVTRAYQALVASGYAEARRGAGTFAAVPGAHARAHDRALLPGNLDDPAVIDLTMAAPSASPGLASAYAAAALDLPAHLGGTGYFPSGLPELQDRLAEHYTRQGVPTRPGQILVTPGALAAAAVIARAFVARGDRVLVESPTYPNVVQALRHEGARLLPTPVGPEGWDEAELRATVSRAAPRLAYLVPDFHNPTGSLLGEEPRARLAHSLGRAGTVPVVDETLRALDLSAPSMPGPLAAHHAGALTLGSASKSHWGGLRVGWIRAPEQHVEPLVRARISLDLGVPVGEQLVLARLLEGDHAGDGRHAEQLARLREQRDALADAVRTLLPDWRFRLPDGGLVLWCALPEARATALAARAERAGVLVAPGPVFAVQGGLGRFVRLSWARPAEVLRAAVERLAEAWAEVAAAGERPAAGRRTTGRVLVA